MTETTDIAGDCIRRYEAAEKLRGNWESHWEEIARRVLPQYASTFFSREMSILQGQKKTEEMVDATAALALPKFAAAMESMLTPRNQTWHRLAAIDKSLMRNRQVRLYFDDVNDTLFRYRYAPRANFASQLHECYMGLGAFGTAPLYVDKLLGPERGLRYRAVHLGEVYFLENHQGVIDTAIRKFPLTSRQAFQKFGDKLPPEIIEKAKLPQSAEAPFWFIHLVTPREDIDAQYDSGRKDTKGMRYGSYYVSITGKAVVGEGGYNTFPYPIGRYVVAPGETYGRSPAMLALPSIKVLNEQKRTVLKQGHRAVDPIILAHDDGVLNGFDMRPGATNWGGVSAEGKLLVHTLPVGNLSLAKEMMEAERLVINDAFLVTLFQILIETPQMTATEVLERAREKGALLSPTMGRQQSEFLGPMIEREIDVLASQGLLPKPPAIIRQAELEYDAIYDSPLSRAQRAESAAGFINWINWARDIIGVTQDPSVLDYANFDTAMPELADMQAVPARWVNDQSIVDAVRAQRAKKQAVESAVQAAPSLASAAKALPQVTTRLAGAAPQ